MDVIGRFFETAGPGSFLGKIDIDFLVHFEVLVWIALNPPHKMPHLHFAIKKIPPDKWLN
jgi:hypothetical protein